MINNFKKKIVKSAGIGLVGVLLCASCENTDLVETYDQYIPENIISLAMPDSVAVVPTDYNKVMFRVFVNADTKIKKAVIRLFDDDLSDDDDKEIASIDINRTVFVPEIYEVEVELPEGGSEYFVHLEDAEGNESIKYDVFGTVLGEAYKESLQPRQYSDVGLYSDTEAVVYWISNRTVNDDEEEVVIDNLLVKTEITYTSSADGLEKTIVVDESEDITIIPDFISEATFSYTTFYKADPDSPYIFESNPEEGTFPVKI